MTASSHRSPTKPNRNESLEMTSVTENAYDRLPYVSYPFPQSHPNHLAALAKLFGMNPPPLATCRVLELGCASGGNLLPMASQMPDATFLGVDLSTRQITDGQAIIKQLGVTNIELRQLDITTIDDAFGKFDYIIAHGVFSWVPKEVQDKILEICQRNLAPHGVAFVSYNTYPGWRMRSMLRDAMIYHANQFANPAQRVQQARALLDFLAQNVPVENNPYGILLKNELQELSKRGDWYIAHEHLEGVNEPIYFHEFAERAVGHRMQYLGEAEFSTMLASNFAPRVAETLRMIAPDLIRMEQYMDFLRNRPFRQSLLVHQGVALNRNLGWKSVAGLYVESQVRQEGGDANLNSGAPVVFKTQIGASLTTPNPITKAAMTVLSRNWPRAMQFEALLKEARALLDEQGPAATSVAPPAPDEQVLGADLLTCFSANIVNLRAMPWRHATKAGERPKASALARLQAAQGPTVTNLRHEMANLDESSRHMLQQLDGERDRAGVLDSLTELVKSGALSIQQNGQRVTEPAAVREALAATIDPVLENFERAALLEE